MKKSNSYYNKEFYVSICMITYNHEKYIQQAIEGILNQQTNFKIQLVIGEDCSTDKTKEICIKYKQKHHKTIKLILHKKNIGMNNNFLSTLNLCEGKYIALCEGDDFWTDPLKLQKQIDFLESNPDYVICFHPVNIKYEEIKKSVKQYHCLYNQKDFFTFNDLIEYSNFIHTPSVVYRNKLLDAFPDWCFTSPACDFPLYCLITKENEVNNRKIGIIKEYMATYRVHIGGVWSSTKRIIQIKNTIIMYLELANNFNLFKNKYWIKTISKIYVTLAYEYFKSLNLKKALTTLYTAIKITSFKHIIKAFIFLFTKKIYKLLKKQDYA